MVGSIELRGQELLLLSLHGLDIIEVGFIVQAVTHEVAEGSEGTFEGVGDGLLLALVEGVGLAATVFDFTVADVLVGGAVSEGDADDSADAHVELAVPDAVHKVYLDRLRLRRPPVIPKHLVR